MSRRAPLIVFAASLAVLIVVVTTLLGDGGADGEFGEVESLEQSLDPSPTTSQPQPPRASSTTAPTTSTVPVRSGFLNETPADEEAVPTGLRLGSIGVDAPVIPLGVDARTGQMEVPNNVSDVAWYRFGPRPGEDGSAVLAAHVDLAGRGPGVFFELRSVQPGDNVVVEFSDGTEKRFRVEARTIYDKDELPLDTIFSQRGAPVLTLVTCGGGFSESSRSYDSNVVVYAVPIDAGTGSNPG